MAPINFSRRQQRIIGHKENSRDAFFWELGTLIIASTLLGNYVSSLKMIGFKWTVDHNCWGPTIQKWQFFVTPTNVCALVWYSLLEFHVRKVWPFFIEATKDPMGSSLLFGIKWSVNPAILCFFSTIVKSSGNALIMGFNPPVFSSVS